MFFDENGKKMTKKEIQAAFDACMQAEYDRIMGWAKPKKPKKPNASVHGESSRQVRDKATIPAYPLTATHAAASGPLGARAAASRGGAGGSTTHGSAAAMDAAMLPLEREMHAELAASWRVYHELREEWRLRCKLDNFRAGVQALQVRPLSAATCIALPAKQRAPDCMCMHAGVCMYAVHVRVQLVAGAGAGA
jgi:hypothetical protein